MYLDCRKDKAPDEHGCVLSFLVLFIMHKTLPLQQKSDLVRVPIKKNILFIFEYSYTGLFTWVTVCLYVTWEVFNFYFVLIGLFSVWLPISIDIFSLRLCFCSFKTQLGKFHGVYATFIPEKIFLFGLWLFCCWHFVTFSILSSCWWFCISFKVS